MKIIAHTFRTFPFKQEVEDIFGKTFVFGKLKADFEEFSNTIKNDVDYIVGVALSEKETRIEPLAVNQFSGDKKIEKDGAEQIELFIPSFNKFHIAPKYTSSFCNWTIYKIANYIALNSLKTKLIFVHINKYDINKLNEFFDTIKRS